MRERNIVAALFALALVWAPLARDAAAQDPGWAVNPAAYQFNMSVTSATYVDGTRGSSMDDVLAAFHGDEIRGVSEPVLVNGLPVHFLTIYSSANGESITFRMYDAAADTVLVGSQQVAFLSNAVLGEPSQPYRIDFGVDPAVNDPSTWGVDPSGFGLTMTATVQVGIDGEELADPDALMAAFAGSDVRGVAGPTMVSGSRAQASTLFFLTVYANVDSELITLRVSSPARDTVYTFDHTFTFAADAVLGTPDAPFLVGTPIITGSESRPTFDESFALDVYPNPSAGDVEIGYEAPVGVPVDLRVYDVLGRAVADLRVRESGVAGRQRIAWRPMDGMGSQLAPGVYILRLEGGGSAISRLMVVSR